MGRKRRKQRYLEMIKKKVEDIIQNAQEGEYLTVGGAVWAQENLLKKDCLESLWQSLPSAVLCSDCTTELEPLDMFLWKWVLQSVNDVEYIRSRQAGETDEPDHVQQQEETQSKKLYAVTHAYLRQSVEAKVEKREITALLGSCLVQKVGLDNPQTFFDAVCRCASDNKGNMNVDLIPEYLDRWLEFLSWCRLKQIDDVAADPPMTWSELQSDSYTPETSSTTKNDRLFLLRQLLDLKQWKNEINSEEYRVADHLLKNDQIVKQRNDLAICVEKMQQSADRTDSLQDHIVDPLIRNVKVMLTYVDADTVISELPLSVSNLQCEIEKHTQTINRILALRSKNSHYGWSEDWCGMIGTKLINQLPRIILRIYSQIDTQHRTGLTTKEEENFFTDLVERTSRQLACENGNKQQNKGPPEMHTLDENVDQIGNDAMKQQTCDQLRQYIYNTVDYLDDELGVVKRQEANGVLQKYDDSDILNQLLEHLGNHEELTDEYLQQVGWTIVEHEIASMRIPSDPIYRQLKETVESTAQQILNELQSEGYITEDTWKDIGERVNNDVLGTVWLDKLIILGFASDTGDISTTALQILLESWILKKAQSSDKTRWDRQLSKSGDDGKPLKREYELALRKLMYALRISPNEEISNREVGNWARYINQCGASDAIAQLSGLDSSILNPEGAGDCTIIIQVINKLPREPVWPTASSREHRGQSIPCSNASELQAARYLADQKHPEVMLNKLRLITKAAAGMMDIEDEEWHTRLERILDRISTEILYSRFRRQSNGADMLWKEITELLDHLYDCHETNTIQHVLEQLGDRYQITSKYGAPNTSQPGQAAPVSGGRPGAYKDNSGVPWRSRPESMSRS